MGKSWIEQFLWYQAVAKFSHYHCNNSIFTVAKYQRDCSKKGQTQSFSIVGAQHQNARAERAIQNFMYMDRIFIVHASLHWYDKGSEDISLWSFDVKHSVWVYNQFPRK